MTELLHVYKSTHDFSFIDDLAIKMSDKLDDRSKPYFKNVILVTACFMDPRYRSLKFIKDQSDRDQAFYDAMRYIKNAYNLKLNK